METHRQHQWRNNAGIMLIYTVHEDACILLRHSVSLYFCLSVLYSTGTGIGTRAQSIGYETLLQCFPRPQGPILRWRLSNG